MIDDDGKNYRRCDTGGTQDRNGIQLQESNRTPHQDLALTQLGLIKLTQLKT